MCRELWTVLRCVCVSCDFVLLGLLSLTSSCCYIVLSEQRACIEATLLQEAPLAISAREAPPPLHENLDTTVRTVATLCDNGKKAAHELIQNFQSACVKIFLWKHQPMCPVD